MRRGAILVTLLALTLFLITIDSAEATATHYQPNIIPPTGSFEWSEDATSCRVPLYANSGRDWLKHGTILQLYTSRDNCGGFNLGHGDDLITARSGTYVLDGTPSTSSTDFSTIITAGERVHDSSGWHSSSKNPILETRSTPLLETPPQHSFTLHQAGICANEMNVEFSTSTAGPTTPWKNFRVDTQSDRYYACRGAFNSRSLDDTRIYRSWTRQVVVNHILGTQGWIATKEPTAYKLPIYCEDIRVDIHEVTHSNWGSTNRYRLASQHAEQANNELHLRFINDGNEFRVNLHDYELGGALNKFNVEIAPRGSVGGVEYSITCIDPKTPHTSQDICEDLSGDYQSTDDGTRCCYEETLNEEQTINGYLNRCDQEGGKHAWESPRVDCGVSGERYLGDPDEYCCSNEAAYEQFMDKPHLWGVEGAVRSAFCTEQGLETIGSRQSKNQYSYNQGNWVACNEAGDIHASNACYQEEEKQWDRCSCTDGSGNQNCGFDEEVGLYCEQENTWSREPGSYCSQSAEEECCGYGAYWVRETATGAPAICADNQYKAFTITGNLELLLSTLREAS